MAYTQAQYTRAYAELRKVATLQQTIGYQELSDVANLGYDMHRSNDRKEIGELLGDISSAEYANGAPMLSAVVVLAHSSPLNPGDGFYTCAASLGKLVPGAAQQPFHAAELTAVHQHWQV